MPSTPPATPAEPTAPGEPGDPGATVSRRSLLGLAGAGMAALGIGAAGGLAVGRSMPAPSPSPSPSPVTGAYPFTGAHQAGITTPAQDRLHFATFDLVTDSREQLIALLKAWTVAADRMTRGLPAGDFAPGAGPYDAPPDDTGEAEGLSASGLTITVGFGPSLFTDADGVDRFGLAARRPQLLADLPHFPADALEDGRCGGDLAVQACADDPQVAVHAVRNLARIAFGKIGRAHV